MKQSEHDPTLKEHFSEEEARQWIRHLEKVIESLEQKIKKAKENNEKFIEKNTYYRRKYNRIIAHFEFLQEKHPDIDFGLEQFKNKFQKLQEE